MQTIKLEGKMNQDMIVFGTESNFSLESHCNFISHSSIESENDLKFSSLLQWMIWNKAILFENYDITNRIIEEDDPIKLNELERNFLYFDQKIWQQIMPDFLMEGNILKFLQNEELSKELLETGDAILAQIDDSNLLYGIGSVTTDGLEFNTGNSIGRNLLGKSLMQTRDKIINNNNCNNNNNNNIIDRNAPISGNNDINLVKKSTSDNNIDVVNKPEDEYVPPSVGTPSVGTPSVILLSNISNNIENEPPKVIPIPNINNNIENEPPKVIPLSNISNNINNNIEYVPTYGVTCEWSDYVKLEDEDVPTDISVDDNIIDDSINENINLKDIENCDINITTHGVTGDIINDEDILKVSKIGNSLNNNNVIIGEIKKDFFKIFAPYKKLYAKQKGKLDEDYMQDLKIDGNTTSDIVEETIANTFVVATLLGFRYGYNKDNTDQNKFSTLKKFIDTLAVKDDNHARLLVSERWFIDRITYYVLCISSDFKVSANKMKRVLQNISKEIRALKIKSASGGNKYSVISINKDSKHEFEKSDDGDFSRAPLTGSPKLFENIDEFSRTKTSFVMPSNDNNINLKSNNYLKDKIIRVLSDYPNMSEFFKNQLRNILADLNEIFNELFDMDNEHFCSYVHKFCDTLEPDCYKIQLLNCLCDIIKMSTSRPEEDRYRNRFEDIHINVTRCNNLNAKDVPQKVVTSKVIDNSIKFDINAKISDELSAVYYGQKVKKKLSQCKISGCTRISKDNTYFCSPDHELLGARLDYCNEISCKKTVYCNFETDEIYEHCYVHLSNDEEYNHNRL
jgi:hypothetical protein